MNYIGKPAVQLDPPVEAHTILPGLTAFQQPNPGQDTANVGTPGT